MTMQKTAEKTTALADLSSAGVAVWLDDLSRSRLASGNLAELISSSSVVGVTTNPSIFASALADGERYDEQVGELAAAGADINSTVFALTTTDVRQACMEPDGMISVIKKGGSSGASTRG